MNFAEIGLTSTHDFSILKTMQSIAFVSVKGGQMKKRLLSAVLLLLFLMNGFVQSAYYVHQGIGNDTTGDGSSGNPWATIQKGLSMLGSTTSRTLYVKSGYTYSLAGYTITNTSGTPAQPILVSKYPSDTSKPTVTGSGAAVFAFGAASVVRNFIVAGFNINGSGTKGFEVLAGKNIQCRSNRVFGAQWGAMLNGNVTNISFRGSVFTNLSIHGIESGNGGIANNVVVSNCKFQTISSLGIQCSSAGSLFGITVKDSEISYTGNQGMQIQGIGQMIVIGNSFHHGSIHGCILYGPTGGVLICSNNRSYKNTSQGFQLFNLSGASKVRVGNNLAYSNGNLGFQYSSPPADSEFARNISAFNNFVGFDIQNPAGVVRNNTAHKNLGVGFSYTVMGGNNYNNLSTSNSRAYTNCSGNYNVGFPTLGSPAAITGTSNRRVNPYYESTAVGSSGFLSLTSCSTCVDRGDPATVDAAIICSRVDIGAKEFDGCFQDCGPSCTNVIVSSISPTIGIAGTTFVTIRGVGFGGGPGPTAYVVFPYNITNKNVGDYSLWSKTNITVRVPSNVKRTNGRLLVLVNSCGNRDYSTAYFTNTLPPTASFSLHVGGRPTLSGVASSFIPGSTLRLTNILSNSRIPFAGIGTNVALYSRVPSSLAYVSNSQNVSAAGWTIQWSVQSQPLFTYGSADFSGTYPGAGIQWVRWIKPQVLTNEKGTVFSYSARLGNGAAGLVLSNWASIQAANAVLVSDSSGFTVKTNLGGSLQSISGDRTNAPGTTNYFSFVLTNRGNATSFFPLRIYYTNASIARTNFIVSLVSNATAGTLNTVTNLLSGDSFSFRARIVIKSSASSNAWLDFKVRAQAGSSTSATNYTGDDGVLYGGTLGRNWDGQSGAAYRGYIYHQDNKTNRITVNVPPPTEKGVIYVNIANRTGPWTGKSWVTAYTQIAGSALTDLAMGATNTILVAAGTYQPLTISSNHNGMAGFTNKIKGYTNGVVIDGANAYNCINMGMDAFPKKYIRFVNLRLTRGNDQAIRAMYSSSNVFERIVVDRCRTGNGWGVFISGSAYNNTFVNCTFVSNTGRGICLAGDAFGTVVRNCIIAFNGEGINGPGVSPPTVMTYNNIVSNKPTGNYNIPNAPGVGTITNDPRFLSRSPVSPDFARLSGTSPCIDKGDPSSPVPLNGGSRIDMGAFEYLVFTTDTSIAVYKSVVSNTLGGMASARLPGSTLTYSISYSNTGILDGNRVALYDKIATNTVILSNSWSPIVPGTATGWTVQFSTVVSPDQSWSSSDYSTAVPAVRNIRWIRWVKHPVAVAEKGLTLVYKVSIK